MKPTMRLRWLIRQAPIPSAFKVLEYRDRYGVSLEKAKQELIARQTPVLQQWHDAEGWEPDALVEAGGEWRDVETEIQLPQPP